MRKTLSAIGLWSLAAGVATASAQPVTATGIDQTRVDEHVRSFDQVWQTIQSRQWDPEFDQDWWAEQRDALRPRVEAATSDSEARAVMRELLASLGKSHFGIIPAAAYDVLTPDEEAFADDAEADDAQNDAQNGAAKDDDADEDKGPGDTGLTVRLRDDRFLVLRVREGSPADNAGVEPGWIITAIGDMETDRIRDAARENAGVQRTETTAALAIEQWLGGIRGTTAKITFELPDGSSKTVDVVRGPLLGSPTKFGNLPETHVYQETRTLDGGVGYYMLNIFMDPPRVMPAFERFVRDHAEAPGLVIDMRGNHGGIILMASGMGGWFVDDPQTYLGTLHLPGGSDLKLILNPRDITYTGPIAVLVDETSISNAELISAGLRDIGRARIFGERSAGLLLPSTVEMLPNRDGFQYAIAGYTSASGSSPEGVGVIPEVRVLETPESLAGGRDPVLEAALDWIQTASR